MSRQLEARREQQRERLDKLTIVAVEFGLVESVSRSGATLLGLSVNFRPEDCLITVRAELAGKKQISFVGAEDFGAALRKVVREANSDGLSWREDKYM